MTSPVFCSSDQCRILNRHITREELVYSDFEMVFGLVMIYSTVHFFVIQKKAWEARTQYEKVVSIVGMISVGLLYLGVLAE